MDALQHCRTLVALRCVELTLLCWSSSLLQALLTFAVLGFRLHLHCLLDRGGKDDLSDLLLMPFDTPGSGCSVASALIVPAGHLHRFLDASGLAGCSFPLYCASPRTSSCLVRSPVVCFVCRWLCPLSLACYETTYKRTMCVCVCVCRETCPLSRLTAPSLCVTSPRGALIGPPTAFRRHGSSVPWVSLPGPTGVVTHPFSP